MNPDRKRVLIIDGSPISLVWQLVLLQEEQLDTLTATHADEGVRIARMELPDLVVIDVATRTAEGLAACRELRTAPETSRIPIMLLLSRGLGGTSMRIDVEFEESITRPFDGAEYLMRIRRCLEWCATSAGRSPA